MHHGTWLYVYFYIKGAVLRTAALTLHHVVTRMVIPLHVWLYIKHIYLYSNIPLYRMRLYITVYSYTRNFAYIHVIYTYVIVPYIFQHRLYVSFSKYVSTLFLYVHTVVYQTTSVQIVHRLSNDVKISS